MEWNKLVSENNAKSDLEFKAREQTLHEFTKCTKLPNSKTLQLITGTRRCVEVRGGDSDDAEEVAGGTCQPKKLFSHSKMLK